MENIAQHKVSDLVTHNINTARVFKKYGIDFCCGGGKPIATVCEQKKINLPQLVDELEAAMTETVAQKMAYDKWPLDFLIEHIVQVHHTYVEENLGILKEYADKVQKVHGGFYTELSEIQQLVHELSAELAGHLKKEELVLFPYVKKLVQLKKSNNPTKPIPHFGKIENPIATMMHEHDHAGSILEKLRTLTKDYTPPESACNTFKAFYKTLEEFEDDLHLHVHLENNILFPKAADLEASFE